MRRGTPRRSEQNQSFDEEIGKIPEQLRSAITGPCTLIGVFFLVVVESLVLLEKSGRYFLIRNGHI